MGEEYFLPVLKNPSYKGTHAIPNFSHKKGSPLSPSSPNPSKNIFPTGPGKQLHLQTCQKLPDSSQSAVGPPRFPTPASYSHLCELLGRKRNPVPGQAAVGGPSTLASWPANHSSLQLPSSPGDGAQRLSQGQEKTWQYRARLRKVPAHPPSPSPPTPPIPTLGGDLHTPPPDPGSSPPQALG